MFISHTFLRVVESSFTRVFSYFNLWWRDARFKNISHERLRASFPRGEDFARETSPKKQSAESIIAVGRVEEIKYEKQRGRRNFTSFADFIKILISCTTFLFTPIQTLAAFQSFLRAVSFCGWINFCFVFFFLFKYWLIHIIYLHSSKIKVLD